MTGSLGNGRCQPVHLGFSARRQPISGGARSFRCLCGVFDPQQVLQIGIGAAGHVMEAVAATELHEQIRFLKGGHREMFPVMSGRDGHNSCARAADGGSRVGKLGACGPCGRIRSVCALDML